MIAVFLYLWDLTFILSFESAWDSSFQSMKPKQWFPNIFSKDSQGQGYFPNSVKWHLSFSSYCLKQIYKAQQMKNYAFIYYEAKIQEISEKDKTKWIVIKK